MKKRALGVCFIFKDKGGWYAVPATVGVVHSWHKVYKSQLAAARGAVKRGYTHAHGPFLPWDGIKSIKYKMKDLVSQARRWKAL